MIPGVRRSQFAAYTLATYVGAIWSLFNCLQSSLSYLEATLKLCQGANLIIQCNFVVINTILLWKGLSKLLFGELRLLEYEHIFEKLSFTLVSSFFVTSMYSGNELLGVLAFEGALIFVKVFHWVLKDRLEYVIQNTDENTSLIRFVFSKFVFNICFLAWVDYATVAYFYKSATFRGKRALDGSTQSILFGTSFAMLFVDVLEVALKTLILAVELRQLRRAQAQNEEEGAGLEGKFIYEMISELICRCIKVGLHSLLLFALFMPVMVVKDIIWDSLAIFQTSRLIWKTLRSNRQIDEKLPTVTRSELDSADERMCIVCMDDMLPTDEITHPRLKPKRLPCSHTLHLGCLKSWMERSQTCPICRVAVFDEKGNVAPSVSTSTAQGQHSPGSESNARSAAHADETVWRRNVASVLPSTPSNNPSGSCRWYAFPTVELQESNGRTIQLSDVTGTEKTLTITHISRPEYQKDTSQVPGKVVISDSFESSSSEIDRLKRRISDLEGKVQELKKRARTE
ncbi:LAFA_0F02498g1_1 [Lachancea sp. 'fantastica']|nr:LAFA_0F02498g1_1 [Lachancea sp. 'fantastica']